MKCEISDQYMEEYYLINPTINDFFMKPEWKRKDYLPNIYSEEYYQKVNQLNKKYIKHLEEKDKLTFYDKILKQDLIDSVHLEDNYEIYMYLPINNISNILIHYVTEASGNGGYIFEKRQDYNDFISRIRSMNEITNEIIRRMEDGIKNGVTLYMGTVSAMINNINNILKNKTYRHYKKTLISKRKWDESIKKYIIINLEKLNHFLINEYYENSSKTQGLHSYKGGKDLYRYIVKMDTLREATPEKIQQIGFSELKQINILKRELEEKVGKGDIDDYIKGNNDDYYKNKEDIITDLHKIRGELINTVYRDNFYGDIKKKDEYDSKHVQLENSHHFAYYIPSDLKNKKRGTFYINTLDPTSINKHELYVLSIHEGIPGHHYENNYNNNSDIKDYFKMANYSAYSEGWGLYCEALGETTNDKRYYFILQYNISRILRLIIDTGIHYFGWEYQKCFDLMKEHLNYSEPTIHRALLRYIDLPGQALTYKIGERTILYLRNKYLRNGGTIKDFHEIIMRLGPCPLNPLIDYFERRGFL